MPAAAPLSNASTAARLTDLGDRIREQRQRLRISAAAAAKAAGLSRVTLHRIERGEASVTMGAWLNVLDALGMTLNVEHAQGAGPAHWPTVKSTPRAPAAEPVARSVKHRQTADESTVTVTVADYPQLQRLAWPLATATVLTAREALSLYERNWRHVDAAAMDAQERALLDSLVSSVGKGQLLV